MNQQSQPASSPMPSKEFLEQIRDRRNARFASRGEPGPVEVSSSTSQTQSSQNQPAATPNLPENVKLEKSRVAPGMYKPVPEEVVLSWVSPSRPFKKRKRQYFTTILIIALLVSLILFFAGQMLPIAVVFSVVFLVYVLSVVPPSEVNNQITTYGIKIEGGTHYWDELGRFWFSDKLGHKILQIETVRFPNRISLLVSDISPDVIREVLSEVLLEETPELTTFEKAANWLQDKIPLE